MQTPIQRRIEAILNQQAIRLRSLSGGMIGDVYKVDFAHIPAIIAKIGESSYDLTIEAYMLQYLKQHSNLPIPKVIHSSSDLMLIEYMQGNSNLTTASQMHLAELLADLHQVTSDQYGLERDTLIGPLAQPNPLSDSWIDFFREHRLRYMSRVAFGAGQLSNDLLVRLYKFADALDKYLIEPEKPSLIHGDMWTTNILVHEGKVTGIIDPSIYYAHNEIELAYMFGSVKEVFFERYQEIVPIDPAFFEVRRHIYSLYPLLVHVRLFGGGYSSMVDSTLKIFGY